MDDPEPKKYTVHFTVKDEENNAISGASIVLTNKTTNASLDPVSTTNGGANITDVLEGTYSAVITKDGFKNGTVSTISVTGDTSTIDVDVVTLEEE